MYPGKYFYTSLFAALFFAQINCSAALAAEAPPAAPSPVIVTLDPISTQPAASQAPAPPPTQLHAPPVVKVPTATTGVTSPPVATPAKQDNTDGFWVVVAIIATLCAIYFYNKRKNDWDGSSNNRDRPIYGDPLDYNRPRGRILSDSERRDLRAEYDRYEPTIDEGSLGPIDGTSSTGFANRPNGETDPMKPRYHRQSQAMLILPSGKDKKTFADVAGQDETVARLREICQWLKQPDIYNRHNADLPRGIMFVGPPGTGKTLCAQALAGETHGSMFIIAASSFVEMYVGVGASRVRALFADAKNQRRQTGKPVIIFIDELDAVGGARNHGPTSNSEREQTLNQLLVEMDGFTKNEGIIVVAATNRVDMLDPALRRKGRFDLEVHMDLPDLNGRQAILKVHTLGKTLDPAVDFTLLARRTFGMSGADLKAAANEAAIIAARHQAALEAAELTEAGSGQTNAAADQAQVLPAAEAQPESVEQNQKSDAAPQAEARQSVIGKTTAITVAMFDEAISIVESGEARRERFKAMTLDDKKQTAYHELGHALVIHKTGGDQITKITILPRGRALGYVQTHTEGDRWNMTEADMRKRITSAMAGRIAQEIFMQTVDTGAASDFEQANRLARKMVTQFGMSPLGALFVPENGQAIGPALSDKIDDEVSKIVAQCGKDARSIIEASRQEIETLVGLLIEKETLFGSDFVAVLEAAETARTSAENSSER